jgi:hypothetical protein
MGFVCKTCGKEHAGTPRDIGFQRPADYFAIPVDERDSRCKITPDSCVIDGSRIFIRGILFVPIHDANDNFGWGLWAEISQTDFETYRAYYRADGRSVPPFRGKLSGEHRGYEGLDGHSVRIQLGSAKDRPEFSLEPSEHLLYLEQRDGITLHRASEILHTVFPDEYPDPSNV